MPEVIIGKPFTLTHQDGTTERFYPGSYDLPDDLAEHWYVQAHAEKERRTTNRVRRGSPEHVTYNEQLTHGDTIAQSAEAAEIAAATADIREKYRKQGIERRNERSRDRPTLNPEARDEALQSRGNGDGSAEANNETRAE